MSHEAVIRQILLGGELLSSRELARRSGMSQPTVSRTLRSMSGIVSTGAGRGSRFGLLHTVGNHGHTWPLYRIGRDGSREHLGDISALEGDHWLVDFRRDEPLLSAGLTNGVSEGWPWFLDGLRPQGFMGRAFARQHHHILGLPHDLNRWGSDSFLLAAYLYGADMPGNLMVGDHPAEVPESVADEHWPELARESVRGNPPGSSAGGERPKFSTGLDLVKFASLDGQERRWADLLVAEAIAGEVLRDAGIAVAHTRLVESASFLFLAVRRFDRTDAGGRIGMHSLSAFDGAFYGNASGAWPEVADLLYRDGWIGPSDRATIHTLWEFGQAIGNNDMHFGNLSFLEDAKGDTIRLAPVYDMLPMRYIPSAAGVPEAGDVNLPQSNVVQSAELARDFWIRVEQDPRISFSFRRVAESNLGETQGIGL
jgi:hypothetical protein